MDKDNKPRALTVKELKYELSAWSDDTEITFGGTLSGHSLVFLRFKRRGEKLLHIDVVEDID